MCENKAYINIGYGLLSLRDKICQISTSAYKNSHVVNLNSKITQSAYSLTSFTQSSGKKSRKVRVNNYNVSDILYYSYSFQNL